MGRLSAEQIDRELARIETAWDKDIRAGNIAEAQATHGARFHELLAQKTELRRESEVSVIRLRFLAGESSRDLDRACAEALGWRVSRDSWWNWHEGPVYDPPGDEWCIRKDGRNDVPCDEALPHFSSEAFERLLADKARP